MSNTNFFIFAGKKYTGQSVTLFLTKTDQGLVLTPNKTNSIYTVNFLSKHYDLIDWSNIYQDFNSFINYFKVVHE